jgi:uncharacterized protein (TIGR02391 family)
MLPSELLEYRILRLALAQGREWLPTDLGNLANALTNKTEEIIDALRRMHARGLVKLRKYITNHGYCEYSGKESPGDFFYLAGFELTVAPDGRPYFEKLEQMMKESAEERPARLVSIAHSQDYQFHPEIERVSGSLYRDGHFKAAAFEAYIRVIEEVKARSGLRLDGDGLMNQAFGCENRIPAIQFNNLQTDAERDEQKGFMFLYKGIVGLRNAKAHSNTLFNDPNRAREYLGLASLLMRLLEIAKINTP